MHAPAAGVGHRPHLILAPDHHIRRHGQHPLQFARVQRPHHQDGYLADPARTQLERLAGLDDR